MKERLRDNIQTWLIERMREDMIRRLKQSATVEYVDPGLLKAVRKQSKGPAER